MFNQADLYYIKHLVISEQRKLYKIELNPNDPELEQICTLLYKIELLIQSEQEYIDLWILSML